MMDKKALDLQLGRFEALKNNIPSFIKEELVDEYNSLVDALSRATGEDLTSFRILPNEVKPKLVSSRPRAYSGRYDRQRIYSKDKYCDDDLFNRRIQSLSHYLESSGFRRSQSVKDAPSSGSVKVGTMINSAIQQGSPHARASINVDIHSADFREFLQKLKDAAGKLGLPPEQFNELHTDIATIEVQLASPNPKKSIIVECGASIRTIFEQVASNLIASGLLPLIHQYFYSQ
jgi:hypothetical protein